MTRFGIRNWRTDELGGGCSGSQPGSGRLSPEFLVLFIDIEDMQSILPIIARGEINAYPSSEELVAIEIETCEKCSIEHRNLESFLRISSNVLRKRDNSDKVGPGSKRLLSSVSWRSIVIAHYFGAIGPGVNPQPSRSGWQATSTNSATKTNTLTEPGEGCH